MIRFDQTPPPSPSWDRHLSTEAKLELALREGRPTVVQRDLGDETDSLEYDRQMGVGDTL